MHVILQQSVVLLCGEVWANLTSRLSVLEKAMDTALRTAVMRPLLHDVMAETVLSNVLLLKE